MAAPHVTGVAALLLSHYPNATTAQLKWAILQGVDKIPALEMCPELGVRLCITGGRLNAHGALLAMETLFSPLQSGTYYIRNRFSGLFLEPQQFYQFNSRVIQNRYFGDIFQRWIVTRHASDIYTIHPASMPDFFLDIHNAGTFNGTEVIVRTFTGHPAQQFHFRRNSCGFFHILPSHVLNFAIDVVNESQAIGAFIHQFQFNANAWSQQWEFIRV
jgi:hypothetical protein